MSLMVGCPEMLNSGRVSLASTNVYCGGKLGYQQEFAMSVHVQTAFEFPNV